MIGSDAFGSGALSELAVPLGFCSRWLVFLQRYLGCMPFQRRILTTYSRLSNLRIR